MVQSFFLFMIMEGRKLGYLHDMSLGDIGTISLLFSFWSFLISKMFCSLQMKIYDRKLIATHKRGYMKILITQLMSQAFLSIRDDKKIDK